MNPKNQKIIFISVIFLQLIFLAGLVFFHSYKIQNATKILLETEPVDPFSVFRGRYIQLNYKISRIPVTLAKVYPSLDQPIYVVLTKKEKFWEPVAVNITRPSDNSVIYLKGKVVRLDKDYFRVDYDMKSFFLSEPSADDIERGQNHRFNGMSWQERERQREEKFSQLNEEDQRINKNNVPWWFKHLEAEMPYWEKEGLVNQESIDKIKEKYTLALERIKKTTQIPETPSQELQNLTIEVAVTNEGHGYPIRLFWQGKEYR